MNDIILFSFITQYFVKKAFVKAGVDRRKGLRDGAVVFFCVMFAFLAYHVGNEPANYYQRLGVTRDVTPAGLKSAYKKQAVRLHPDKNTAANAEEEFNAMRRGYDVLSDREDRMIYDTFGEEFMRHPQYKGLLTSPMNMFFHHCMFYLATAFFSYVFSLGQSKRASRQWNFLGLVLVFILELFMTHGDLDLFTGLFPSTTPYQKLQVLKKMYFYMTQGSMFIAEYLYVDKEGMRLALLQHIAQTNNQILAILDSEPWRKSGGGGGGKVEHGVTESKPPNQKHLMAQSKRAADLATQAEQKQSGGIPIGTIIFVVITVLQWWFN